MKPEIKSKLDDYCERYVVRLHDRLETPMQCVYWLEYYRLVYRHMMTLKASEHCLRPMEIALRRGRQAWRRLHWYDSSHPALAGHIINDELPLKAQYEALNRYIKPLMEE